MGRRERRRDGGGKKKRWVGGNGRASRCERLDANCDRGKVTDDVSVDGTVLILLLRLSRPGSEQEVEKPAKTCKVM